MNPAREPESGSAIEKQRVLRSPSEAADEWELLDVEIELPPEVERRVRVMQQLMAAQGSKTYTKVQREAARSLGISLRSLRRLIKAWQRSGIAGLSRQTRSDQGSIRTSQEWQDFIIKTYREGNRGSRKMSPAQVGLQVRSRAQVLGVEDYPGRTTIYRILAPHIEKQQQKRSLGWKQDRLMLKTREGLSIEIEWSNQVWQVDHTRADVLVVDQAGEVLGRPWLTLVVDTYSRCLMGMHLSFDAPSSAVVCLALRHAILPKQYNSGYELQGSWGTYGLPKYLYTDGGKDFRSQHLEQVATELGIVLCLRRKPSDGGIVERPFGTFNTQFFSTLPGYVSSKVETRYEQAQASPTPDAETEACLTLMQLEQLLVRYLVDHYNQASELRSGFANDARMGNQSRIGRWEAGRIAQLPLLGERELDLCLMRRDQRRVYRSGYLQFASLTYQGEHLAAYAGETVILRYNPRDITTVYVYQIQDNKEVFLARAHAMGWETETLSYREAQALSERRRAAGKAISNGSMLEEVRDRGQRIKKLQKQQKQQKQNENTPAKPDVGERDARINAPAPRINSPATEPAASEPEPIRPKKPVPYVRVYDYEDLKREAGLL
jgi:putative transposase